MGVPLFRQSTLSCMYVIKLSSLAVVVFTTSARSKTIHEIQDNCVGSIDVAR